MLAEKDPLATALFDKYKQVIMPNLRIGNTDLNELLKYLEGQSAPHAKDAPAGEKIGAVQTESGNGIRKGDEITGLMALRFTTTYRLQSALAIGRAESPLSAAVENTAMHPPWKKLRVFPFSHRTTTPIGGNSDKPSGQLLETVT
jgi:hypothetical protein